MNDFTSQFQPIAEEYRRKEKRRTKVIIYFVVCCLLGIIVGNVDSYLLKVLWYLNFLAIIILFAASWYKPLCPSCHSDVVAALGTYCPECGGTLQQVGALRGFECAGCGLRPSRNRGRNYKVRWCSSCGVKLDEAGI